MPTREKFVVVLVSDNSKRWSAVVHKVKGHPLPSVVTADHRTFVHRANQPDYVYHEAKALPAFNIQPQEYDEQQSWFAALRRLPEASNSSPVIRELRGQEDF